MELIRKIKGGAEEGVGLGLELGLELTKTRPTLSVSPLMQT